MASFVSVRDFKQAQIDDFVMFFNFIMKCLCYINKERVMYVDIRYCYVLQVPLSWRSQTLSGVMLLA